MEGKDHKISYFGGDILMSNVSGLPVSHFVSQKSDVLNQETKRSEKIKGFANNEVQVPERSRNT
jgi:hypothetical protein